MEPPWKGQGCLTKVAKCGPFPCTILYKSCFYYPSWQATSFERPPSWVALIEGFHCICILTPKSITGTPIKKCTRTRILKCCLQDDSHFAQALMFSEHRKRWLSDFFIHWKHNFGRVLIEYFTTCSEFDKHFLDWRQIHLPLNHVLCGLNWGQENTLVYKMSFHRIENK